MSGMSRLFINKVVDDKFVIPDGAIVTDSKSDLLKKVSAAEIIENILEDELNIIAEEKRKNITNKLVKRLKLDNTFYVMLGEDYEITIVHGYME